MDKINTATSIFAFLFLLCPLNLYAEQKIQLSEIVPTEIIEKTINIYMETEQHYILKRFEKEIKIEFKKPAKAFLVTTYQKTKVPKKFIDEKKFPLFTDVVIKDIEKVTWKSYYYSVKRYYKSMLNFYAMLRKGQDIKDMFIILKDVESSLKFWNCNAIPQPPPPKCPKNCVEETYQKTVNYYLR